MSSIDLEAAKKLGDALHRMALNYADGIGGTRKQRADRADKWLGQAAQFFRNVGVPVVLEGINAISLELFRIGPAEKYLHGDAYAAFKTIRQWDSARFEQSPGKSLDALPDPKNLSIEQLALLLAVSHAMGRTLSLIGADRAHSIRSIDGSGKGTNPHQKEALKLFAKEKSTGISDTRAFKAVSVELKKRYREGPGLSTVRTWVLADRVEKSTEKS